MIPMQSKVVFNRKVARGGGVMRAGRVDFA